MDNSCNPKLPANEKYGCWQPPVLSFPKPEVTVNNPKYCPMYPIKHDCKSKRVTPKLLNCTIKYTKWDYILESITHEQVLLVNEAFKKYKLLLEAEVKQQCKWSDRLCDIAFRYKKLTRGGVCVELYPEIVSAPMQEIALNDFDDYHQRIDRSNRVLIVALREIASLIAELERRYKRLDLTHDTIFLKGNANVPSFHYVRQLIIDTFTYFNTQLSNMKYASLLLEAKDPEACDAYAALVNPNKKDPYEVMDLNTKVKSMQVRMIRCPHCRI